MSVNISNTTSIDALHIAKKSHLFYCFFIQTKKNKSSMENHQIRNYSSYCKWPTGAPAQDKGIIIATDITQEWLLTWWWENYIQHNDLPVSFVDLGMSKEMKNWCLDKGNYIPLPVPDIFVKEKDFFSEAHIKKWEHEFGTYFWGSRNAWFKKPLACLQSPYKTSLWIDLDCEVRGSLDPLFSLPLPSGISIAKKYCEEKEEDINSGVIVFKYGAALIEQWAEESFKENHVFVGDQDILQFLINKNNLETGTLPPLYNWSRFNKDNPEAIVMHWHGNYGKSTISHQIAKTNLMLSGLI